MCFLILLYKKHFSLILICLDKILRKKNRICKIKGKKKSIFSFFLEAVISRNS